MTRNFPMDYKVSTFFYTLQLNFIYFCYRWAVNTVSTDLLSELLPGPVTLIFERRETLNPCLNPNKRTVGLRIPDSPFIVELARTFDNPIALTSANLSAEQSTLAVEVRILQYILYVIYLYSAE